MDSSLSNHIRSFRDRHKKNRQRKFILGTAAAAVLVATSVVMSLPAITATPELTCGLEEHTHTDDCYTETRTLVCTQAESAGHTHTDACYTPVQNLICGQEERAGHTHSDSCYTAQTSLVCGQQERAGHTHSGSCYDEDGNLICGQAEDAGHTHSDSCYHTDYILTCGQAEDPGHTHSDSCYETDYVLSCGETESAGHTHDDSCYLITEDLTCGKEEHTHTADCYEAGGTLKSQTSDKMTAEVTYEAGVLHEGSALSAKLLQNKDEEDAQWYIDKFLASENKETSEIYAYDLSVARNGNLTQPDGTVDVKLSFNTYVSSDDKEIEWRFFHIYSDGSVKELTKDKYTTFKTRKQGDRLEIEELSFRTDSFSWYVLAGVTEIEKETEAETSESVEAETEAEEITEAVAEQVTEAETELTEETEIESESETETEIETETEAETEVSYPEAAFTRSANGIKVSVFAEEGAFPEGTTMKVTKVTDDEVLDEAIAASGMENAEAAAVDISFYDAEGNSIEPAKAIRVTMQADVVAENEEITVVHVDDDNHAEVVEQTDSSELAKDEQPAEDQVVFDADAFSVYALVYTVDFYFGDYEYHLQGGESMMLSELLEVLKIEKNKDGDLLTVEDIQNVEFSNESLLKVTEEDGDWKLESLQAFTSEEQLVLTLKSGDEVVIDVTDAATPAGMTINGVTLAVNGTTYDLKTTDTVSIKNTDTVEFTMDFSIAGGTLSADNNTIEYQLPSGIVVTEAVTNKNIMNGNTIVGTYSISTDGKVTFVFNDSYVEKNANGSKIDVDLSFTASVDSSNTEDGGEVPIAFTDEIKVDMEVEKVETGDLTVSKSVSSNNYNDGYITYTVVVSSTEGTTGAVTLKDIVTPSGFDITSLSNFTISPELSGFNPNTSASGFDVTLPKLDAGSTYTITYRVNYDKKDIPLTGETVNNKITGTSTASKGTELTSSAEINTEVKPGEIISKWGSYNNESDQVTWYVTINKQGANLNGWTLQDTLNGTAFTGNVMVDPAINGQTSITLPYTWTVDDYNTYTITYITSADALIGNWGAVNNATLTNGNSDFSTGDVTSGSGVQYLPLDKKADKITANADNTLATVDWTVAISASKGTISAEWTYKDELWNGQWFTGTQLKAIKAAIDQALKDAGLSLSYTMKANLQKGTDEIGDEVSFDQITDEGKYKVYTLYFSSDLEKGSSFTYSYQSTAPIEGLESNTTFRNNAYIEDKNGNKVYDDGQIVYEPPKQPEIIKTDGNSENDTSHDVTSLDGTFQWDLKVTIPSDYSGTSLSVVEHLPTGVSLDDLEILAQGQTDTIFGATHFESLSLGENKITIDGTGGPFEIILTITEREDGGLDAKVVIPENLVKHSDIKEVRFVVKVHPTTTADNISDENSGWSKDDDGYWYRKFDNTVELINKDNKTISTDSQNQTITLKDGKQLVDKAAGTVNDNVIPYSLKINPDGEDLVKGSDTITLTDILNYEYNIWDMVNANYINDSLAVYEINKDGETVRKLDSPEYSFTYEESIDYTEYGKGTAVRTLKVVLPDSTPLMVEYKYLVSQPNDGYGKWRTISNRAYLDGYSDNRYSDSTSTSVQVQKSSAHATIEGVTLKKVDADDYQIELEGVTFTLYKYDAATDSYISTDKTYSTDESGNINFTKEDIAYETAYKLVEESTNEDYFKEKSPFYFIVTEVDLTEGQSTNYTAPIDFDGTIYSVGSTFYFPNRKIPEKGLSVRKIWKDYYGNVITDTSKMPDIILRLKNGDKVVKTFTLNEDNGWTELFEDLDADGKYTIEEATELVGYNPAVVVYYEGDSKTVDYISGDAYGTVTVTNQPSAQTPGNVSTRVVVKKKWVDIDGVTELSEDEISNLSAKIELVRYKAEKQGTIVHFIKNTNSSDFKQYENIFDDFIVASQDSVTIIISTTYWNPTVYVLSSIPDYPNEYDKGFYVIGNNSAKATVAGVDTTGDIKTYSVTFSTAGLSDIYLYVSSDGAGIIAGEGCEVANDSGPTAGEAVVDTAYSNPVTLSSTNAWNAVFTGLPVSGTEDGKEYFYTYAIKEVSCSEGFQLDFYSVGTGDTFGTDTPISNISGNITVTNKKKEAYTLPNTGGTGTFKYILSGFSLMFIALLLLFRRKSEGRRAM